MNWKTKQHKNWKKCDINPSHDKKAALFEKRNAITFPTPFSTTVFF